MATLEELKEAHGALITNSIDVTVENIDGSISYPDITLEKFEHVDLYHLSNEEKVVVQLIDREFKGHDEEEWFAHVSVSNLEPITSPSDFNEARRRIK